MRHFPSFSLKICILFIFPVLQCFELDHNGYILFCPCMGRFGNQADHYLGSLGFAKGLNRTLVLPPWVEYPSTSPFKSLQIPFKDYFNVSILSEYHKVLPMESFMEKVAPTLWPKYKRIVFCYSPRNKETNGCDAKVGNPFESFWNTFNIDFDGGSEIYGQHGLNYDVYHRSMGDRWKEKYPSSTWPVLAFTGAPASFPIQAENIHIHKYLKWNNEYNNRASKWIAEHLPKKPFLGIHLRNGPDWKKACELIPSSKSLFASPQCLDHNSQFSLTSEMCFPNSSTILFYLGTWLKKKEFKSVFVATDYDSQFSFLQKHFPDVYFSKTNGSSPHLDLVILGKSHHFIGNCVSSFSGFVKRERDTLGFPSSFWGFPPQKKKSKLKDEL